MKKSIFIILPILLIICIFSYSSIGIFYKPIEINPLGIIVILGVIFLCCFIYYKKKHKER